MRLRPDSFQDPWRYINFICICMCISNPLFSCDHMHEVGRGTDSGKEWNYASRTIPLPFNMVWDIPHSITTIRQSTI